MGIAHPSPVLVLARAKNVTTRRSRWWWPQPVAPAESGCHLGALLELLGVGDRGEEAKLRRRRHHFQQGHIAKLREEGDVDLDESRRVWTTPNKNQEEVGR
jgi:hypothetical protein